MSSNEQIKICRSCNHKYVGVGCLSRVGDYEVCKVCGSVEALKTCLSGKELQDQIDKVTRIHIDNNLTNWVD